MGSRGELIFHQWILLLRVHSCPSSAQLPFAVWQRRVRHFRMTSQREPGELRVSQRLVDSQSNPHTCESCQDYPSLDCYQKKTSGNRAHFRLWKCSFFHLLVFLYHSIHPWRCDPFPCPRGDEVAGHLYTRSSRSWLLRCLYHTHLFLLPGSFSVVLSHNWDVNTFLYQKYYFFFTLCLFDSVKKTKEPTVCCIPYKVLRGS